MPYDRRVRDSAKCGNFNHHTRVRFANLKEICRDSTARKDANERAEKRFSDQPLEGHERVVYRVREQARADSGPVHRSDKRRAAWRDAFNAGWERGRTASKRDP